MSPELFNNRNKCWKPNCMSKSEFRYILFLNSNQGVKQIQIHHVTYLENVLIIDDITTLKNMIEHIYIQLANMATTSFIRLSWLWFFLAVTRKGKKKKKKKRTKTKTRKKKKKNNNNNDNNNCLNYFLKVGISLYISTSTQGVFTSNKCYNSRHNFKKMREFSSQAIRQQINYHLETWI